MDFTREPLIESIITPKEGCKLVVRNSKAAGQEEYFVDAVELVSFGNTFFLRSLEKPKAFLVPASDYEILEVRETRMVLKHVGVDRSIKIGTGREAPKKPAKEHVKEAAVAQEITEKAEPKKRDRRRHYRKKRGREEQQVREEQPSAEFEEGIAAEQEKFHLSEREKFLEMEEAGIGTPIPPPPPARSGLIPPPPTLISETIERYKGDELFKDVFYTKRELSSLQEFEEEKLEAPGAFEPPSEEQEPFENERRPDYSNESP